MKLVITGASGFLGRYIVARLLDEPGMEIWCSSRSRATVQELQHLNVHWLMGDLSSPSFCRELVSGKDAILHLAHSGHPLNSEQSWPADILANAYTASVLLQAIRDVGNRPHVVFSSSGGAVYGDSLGWRPLREDDPCYPGCVYGVQKLMTEHHLRLLSSRGQLTACILRIANAYGRLLPTYRRQGLIGVAMARVIQGEPVPIFGSMANVRDYIHIDDVYKVIQKALYRRNEFEVFNVGTGKGVTVSKVVALIEHVTRLKAILHRETSVDDSGLAKFCILCPDKAAAELDWRARIELEQGVKMMYESWMACFSSSGAQALKRLAN
jgi:UDP-glucose 4-epimerase